MSKRIVLIVAILFAAVTAQAEAPKTISYQGRITDAAGVPVPDGPQSVMFRIYNAPVGGTLLWSEPTVAVTTEKGLFTTTLGSPTAFPSSWAPNGAEKIFTDVQQLWLEIDVNGVTQSPRTQLQSVPFAVAASNLSGRGSLYPNIGIVTFSDFAQLSTFGYDGEEKARIWGPAWGEIRLSDEGPTFGTTSEVTAVLSAQPNSGGTLTLGDNVGSPTILLNGGGSGDVAAVLPSSAIDANEILDEPGIAVSKYTGGGISLAMSEAFSINVIAVTITIPAAGYIVLDGIMYTVNNNPGSSFSWAQITETPGAPWLLGRSVWVNSFNYANAAGAYTYVNTPVKATVFKGAPGSYTFFLQGNAYSGNTGGTAVSALSPSWIQATYFPTSYGTVMSVAATQPSDNAEYTSDNVTDPQTRATTTVFTQDLRYYEIQAQQAHIRDLEAQMALEKARITAGAKGTSQRTDAAGITGEQK